jgi:pimeloyl-ACP methyl ester carboxylesterase
MTPSPLFYIKKKARTFVLKGIHQGIRAGLSLSDRLHPHQAAFWGEKLFLKPTHYRRTSNERKVLSRASQGVVQVGNDLVRLWSWGSGPRVVLAHGWSGRGGQFYPWVDLLTEAGFSVTLFDAPGHGSSEGNTGSLVQMVKSLQAIAAAYGPLHAVIGHSLGGAAALVAAAQGLPTEYVVTLNAPADILQVMENSMRSMGLRKKSIERIWAGLEQRFGIQLHDYQPHQQAYRIKQKVLLIHDLDDKEVHWKDQELLHQKIPHAEVLTTKGHGHYRILRHTQAILKTRQFLMGEGVEPLASPAMDLILGQQGYL